MKKLLLLLLIGMVIFVAVYRERLFVRDPIATVKRDGVKQGDVKVMINYSNDVLLDDGSTDKRKLYLVQDYNKVASYSTGVLKCLRWTGCMTDGDQATAAPFTPGARGARGAFGGVTMTNKQVEFVDERGALVEVTLRP